MDIYKKFGELAAEGIAAALCTIIETKGSTPRKAGSKMIVTAEDITYGSVGGGKLELQVIADALKVIEDGHPFLKNYSAGEENDMHCYGECRIFIDPLPGNNTLYIFGAGHVGKEIAGIAGSYGFRVTLIDHRQELLDKLNIPGVTNICRDYIKATADLPFNNNTYIVVTTPSHASDEEVTLLCAPKPHAYLGMIGSKKKVALARELFAKKGLEENLINSIDMPIGIPMNCETPREIAISILARLIDIKNSEQAE